MLRTFFKSQRRLALRTINKNFLENHGDGYRTKLLRKKKVSWEALRHHMSNDKLKFVVKIVFSVGGYIDVIQ